VRQCPARSGTFLGEAIRPAITLVALQVALRDDGVSSFPGLQTALKTGRDDKLFFYVFDLLHLDGWDLRCCTLLERKCVLAGLTDWTGMLRYSDHHIGEAAAMWRNACEMHLEGIVCKQGSALYRAGRGGSWVKVKCGGRDEFIVLALPPPGGSRTGFVALHVGYYDPKGDLHYAGGVGSGFDGKELGTIRSRLDLMASAAPERLLVSGDPIDRSVTWVRPEIVIEVQFTDWSGSGRLRHPVYRHSGRQGRPRCGSTRGRPRGGAPALQTRP
jgi:bifunctional non-homologous end joining protein LigD